MRKRSAFRDRLSIDPISFEETSLGEMGPERSFHLFRNPSELQTALGNDSSQDLHAPRWGAVEIPMLEGGEKHEENIVVAVGDFFHGFAVREQ